MRQVRYFLLAAITAFAITSCDKVEGGYKIPEEIPPITRAGEITFNHYAYSLEIGEEFDLSFDYTMDGVNDGDIVLTNSDESVASFENGRVVALSEGKTTIKATWLKDEAVAGTCVVSVVPVPVITNCREDDPSFLENLGTLFPMSDRIWRAGNQEWTDAIRASGAKTDEVGTPNFFNGGEEGNYYCSDCRLNNYYKYFPDPVGYGDLFSWCAAVKYRKNICPEGWRLPRAKDFKQLFVNFGGPNTGRGEKVVNQGASDKMIAGWGNRWGSYCNQYEVLHADNTAEAMNDLTKALVGVSVYWTADQQNDYDAIHFEMNVINRHPTFTPEGVFSKRFGEQIRCMRDIK